MHSGKRYKLKDTLRWTFKYILIFTIWASIPVALHSVFHFEWMKLPWEPVSVVGIAVAFYLGFKNSASYDRLWEARKIWGGIVNASRSFTVMVREFVNNEHAQEVQSEETLKDIKKTIVYRHIAWLWAMTIELRKLKPWEHNNDREQDFRKKLGSNFDESDFEQLKEYLSAEEYEYLMTKGNRSSHLVSLQSKHLMKLRLAGIVEHFRHLEMQSMITEFYTLQGKSERIKNYPFPRQYAAVNYYFVVLFIMLLPFAMLDIFHLGASEHWIWLAVPFSVVCSWVFWMMELIGEYSENPFEGLYNDVPISSLSRSIEIDIRQMLDETDLPGPLKANNNMEIII